MQAAAGVAFGHIWPEQAGQPLAAVGDARGESQVGEQGLGRERRDFYRHSIELHLELPKEEDLEYPLAPELFSRIKFWSQAEWRAVRSRDQQ